MASKSSKKKMVAIAGSKKTPYRNAQVIAPAPSDERLEVSLRIRPKNNLPKAEDMLKPSNGPLPQLTHERIREILWRRRQGPGCSQQIRQGQQP